MAAMRAARGRLTNLARRQGILLVFVVLVAVLFAAKSTFGTYQNIINVLQQNSVIGIIACGMTFAIILGGFDLSVGSVTALSNVVGATIMIEMGAPGIPVGIVGALLSCLLVGAANGWLIAVLGVNPFVTTLGSMTVVRGLLYVATNASPHFGVPYSFTTLGLGYIFGVPAGIPIIEANNKAGFARSEVKVDTYVGADDVDFGRLQGKLLDQAFGGKKARVAYVMGFAGSPAQVLRAKGWDEFRAKNTQYEEVARVTDDFDSAKALAAVQDLLSRFPKGQLDAIVMQGPEAGAAVDFATRNGRDEVKFIVGDYPADVRQLIYEGKIFGTVDQDPYPQAYNAMRMAWLHFNGKDAEIPKPYFLPLPLVTKDNAEKTPAAWGC